MVCNLVYCRIDAAVSGDIAEYCTQFDHDFYICTIGKGPRTKHA